MGDDRHRIMWCPTKSHGERRCTAIWLCAHLLLFGLCEGLQQQLQGSREALRPWTHRTDLHHRQQKHWLPNTILGTHAAVQSPRATLHLNGDSRRRRSVLAAAGSAASAAGPPIPPLLPYPREAGAVQRYLTDALVAASAPYTIPVWFVVVVDPNNVAATNVTSQQLQDQIHLLNEAYMTGLLESDSIIQESGAYETHTREINFDSMVRSEGPVTKTTANLEEDMAKYKAQGPQKQVQLESERLLVGDPAAESAAAAGNNKVASAETPVPALTGTRSATSSAQPSGPLTMRKPLAAQEAIRPHRQLSKQHLASRRPRLTSAAVHRQLSAESSSSSSRQLWRFELKGVRYTSSSTPMCVGSTTELNFKKFWRSNLVQEGETSPDGTLVIYVSQLTSDKCKGLVAGYSVMFGFGTSPFDLIYWKEHQEDYRDGVVIDSAYLLNAKFQADSGSGPLHGASSGAQLIHEVGHWMGLIHTFEGGCSTDVALTDQVDDTPAEASPTKWGLDLLDSSSACSYRDTCGNLVAPDMYYNYMDYMNLACARAFTPGQQARMLYLFRAVRRKQG